MIPINQSVYVNNRHVFSITDDGSVRIGDDSSSISYNQEGGVRFRGEIDKSNNIPFGASLIERPEKVSDVGNGVLFKLSDDAVYGTLNVSLNGLHLKKETDYTHGSSREIYFLVDIEDEDVVTASYSSFDGVMRFSEVLSKSESWILPNSYLTEGVYRPKTLRVYLNGQEIENGSEYVCGSEVFILHEETESGDTITCSYQTFSDPLWVFQSGLDGVVDGDNCLFSVESQMVPGSSFLVLNGQRLSLNSDYHEESSTEILFLTPPTSLDDFWITYKKEEE